MLSKNTFLPLIQKRTKKKEILLSNAINSLSSSKVNKSHHQHKFILNNNESTQSLKDVQTNKKQVSNFTKKYIQKLSNKNSCISNIHNKNSSFSYESYQKHRQNNLSNRKKIEQEKSLQKKEKDESRHKNKESKQVSSKKIQAQSHAVNQRKKSDFNMSKQSKIAIICPIKLSKPNHKQSNHLLTQISYNQMKLMKSILFSKQKRDSILLKNNNLNLSNKYGLLKANLSRSLQNDLCVIKYYEQDNEYDEIKQRHQRRYNQNLNNNNDQYNNVQQNKAIQYNTQNQHRYSIPTNKTRIHSLFLSQKKLQPGTLFHNSYNDTSLINQQSLIVNPFNNNPQMKQSQITRTKPFLKLKKFSNKSQHKRYEYQIYQNDNNWVDKRNNYQNVSNINVNNVNIMKNVSNMNVNNVNIMNKQKKKKSKLKIKLKNTTFDIKPWINQIKQYDDL